MSDQATYTPSFSLWVLVSSDGKWMPDSKYAGGDFNRAVSRAEELDRSPDFDAVRVMKVSAAGGEPKEIWASSRLKDREQARRANQLSAGVRMSAEGMAAKRA